MANRTTGQATPRVSDASLRLTCCVLVAERAHAGGETVATVIRLEAGSETRLPAFYSCMAPILEGHYTASVDNKGFCSKLIEL